MDALREEFIKIARELNRLELCATSRCPDQFVGAVSKFGRELNTSELFCRRVPADSRSDSSRVAVIVILESPHIREFKKDGTAIGPLNNLNTQRSFRNMLTKACPAVHELPDGELPVILVNAIQFQCSLAAKPKLFRTNVFLRLWAANAAVDLQTRLKRLVKHDDLLINACTKGDSKPALCELVSETISTEWPNFKSAPHPAWWWKLAR